MKKLIIFTLFAVGYAALAQDAAVIPPTYLDGIIAWLGANAAMVGSAVAVLEVVIRMIPSVKPLSLLIPAKYLVDGAIVIFGTLSGAMGSMISAFNIVKPPALK